MIARNHSYDAPCLDPAQQLSKQRFALSHKAFDDLVLQVFLYVITPARMNENAIRFGMILHGILPRPISGDQRNRPVR